MTDLERQALAVWSTDVRALVDEAIRCYNAGAVRASIAATWTAVIADLIDKIIILADDGDLDASTFRTSVEQAQTYGIKPDGVRAMQQIEDKLLDQAMRFELIDSIGVRELNRIREDRNLCVHPSLRHLSETYDPRPEVARGHLAVALSTVLIHPPTQGRKALDDFTAYVTNPHFVASERHLLATFFDRLRSGTRNNIVKVATKHVMCEVSPPSYVALTADVIADRMGETLKLFARRDRDLVRRTMATVYPRFQTAGTDVQLRVLVRLGDQDFFWDTVEDPLTEHLDASISAIAVPSEYEQLPAETAVLLALVREPAASTRLPSLQRRYLALSWKHRMDVAAARPNEYFIPTVIEYVRDAGSFDGATQTGEQLVVPHAPYLSVESLEQVLDAWAANNQCVGARRMPGIAVELFAGTAHLGPARLPIWQKFVDTVAGGTERDPWFNYHGIDQALAQATA